MTFLLIICLCIVGCLILGGGAVIILWAAHHYDGFHTLLGIMGCFILAYVIITGMVHIIRIYCDLPPLPWEFANIELP